MRLIGLTISINGEMPNYESDLMREIFEWFKDKGYHYALILDQKTRPYGMYLLQTDSPRVTLTEERCEDFLTKYNSKGVKYRLKSLEDVFELDFIPKE